MGATTYRLMSGFATELPDDPGVAALTALPKVVFSSTWEAPLSWAKSELVDGDAVETVKDMKRRDSRADHRKPQPVPVAAPLQLLEYVPTLLDGPPGVGDWPELT